ncbi:MAG TPA: hypothetical protein VFW98_05650 [Gemmatimonadaceae bacterium]|nr:hypothetical protein [Gemmatimonadaceae bacterium]
MHRSRASRSVAILTTILFAFQLWLTGSGMACIMSTRGNTRMEGSMRGAASAPMAMHDHDAMRASPSASAGTASMPQPVPCDQQTHPSVCNAMGPCITALIAPAVVVNVGPSRTPPVLAMVALRPPLPTFPPDLPPPRA